ncbi:FkbM family methyltransferase [Sphingobium sp. EP60837]|uniref:FkbM family methyltransferase n=1 Tax=Sphingobium sp. EP60837 TaxID=1855519 RepID=UPI0007DD91EF|nr:FkbM family methyltransferase [Sphingobium sp. EP60837]ANI78462.1 hypothetical protein EP837_02054 [Sphingobium sp. EP60837]
MTDIIKTMRNLATEMSKLIELADESEGHAYSVRQLIAQRERLFEILSVIGRECDNIDGISLKRIIDCIPITSSQFYQDIFCLLINRGKNRGFFVEFGACDGKFISNTFILEKYFNWRGILAEPAMHWRNTVKNNRSCKVDTRCVWSISGEKVQFAEYERDEHLAESSILAEDKENHTPKNIYEVETISLNDLLRVHKAPKVIDFISIDVEGAEVSILDSFDFSKHNFKFATIETKFHRSDIIDLMSNKGYRPIFEHVSGHDTMFVPYKPS